MRHRVRYLAVVAGRRRRQHAALRTSTATCHLLASFHGKCITLSL